MDQRAICKPVFARYCARAGAALQFERDQNSIDLAQHQRLGRAVALHDFARVKLERTGTEFHAARALTFAAQQFGIGRSSKHMLIGFTRRKPNRDCWLAPRDPGAVDRLQGQRSAPVAGNRQR